MKHKSDVAVSPVVGVMLMLVVTIIIAAVVSAFSGGMVAETKKAPQASISATFSQSKGMEIYHKGGDTLNTAEITLMVKPTKSFGNYQHLSWVVNKSILQTNGKDWVNATESSSYKLARTFQPGDLATISAANLPFIQEKSGSTADFTSNSFGFGNTEYSIGNSFTLTINDESGRPVASTEVKIDP